MSALQQNESIRNGRKGRAGTSCSNNFTQIGQTKFGSVISLLLNLTIGIIISVLSLICFQERLFPIESLGIAVRNYSLKHLSKPIQRKNRKRGLCFTVTGGRSTCLLRLYICWRALKLNNPFLGPDVHMIMQSQKHFSQFSKKKNYIGGTILPKQI